MQYKRIQPVTKYEAEAVFAQGTSEHIIEALLGVTYHGEDWRWVQHTCLTFLDRPDPQIQWTAIQCLGHLATFQTTLDLAMVLPALQAHEADPKLAPVLSNTWSDITMAIKKRPELVMNWSDVPPELKQRLREEGVFDRHGKKTKQRNVLSRFLTH